MPIYEITGRRPSKATIKAKVQAGLQVTNKATVVWGENELTVERCYYGNFNRTTLRGVGWIGPVGGADLAEAMNLEDAAKQLEG